MQILIGIIIGLAIGLIIGFKFKKTKLDVEEALAFLKSKGYWVKLNVGPDSK